MTPTALALAALHWTATDLALEARCNRSLARRWTAGSVPTPPCIAEWLARRVAASERLPCPSWRVGPGRRAAVGGK